MTSRERLLAAYRRQRPDRVPINIRGVRVHDERWMANHHPSYEPLIEIVQRECDIQGGWGAPQGWLLTASEDVRHEHVTHDSPDWRYEESIAHTPTGPLSYVNRVSKHEFSSLTHRFWVKNEEDLDRFLSVPYEPPKPDTSGWRGSLERMGGRGVVMVGSNDPIAFVHDLLGSTLLGIWSIERRTVIDRLVELFTERLLDWYEHLIAGGVTGIFAFIGAEYVAPPLMHPRYFRDWVTNPMKRITDRLHEAGALVHVHSHGPLDVVFEQFVEMGADVLHPIEAPTMGDITLVDAKRRIGDRVCLEGNIQIGDIYGGEEWEIRDAVKLAIDSAAEGGGFVLCPTASPYTPVLPDRALRNYVTMIETAVEYGGY